MIPPRTFHPSFASASVLAESRASASLREWATKELKGYGADDALPSYRMTRSLLFLDAAIPGGRVSGQQVPLTLIPDVARSSIQGDIHLPQPIAEIGDLVSSARRDGEDSIRLSPPLAQETSRPDEQRPLQTGATVVGRGSRSPSQPKSSNASTGRSAPLVPSSPSSTRSAPHLLSS